MSSSRSHKRNASPLMSQAFKPSAWLSNIDFIKRLISFNHLLIVIMTEAQGGKSTFVDLMRFKLEPSIQTVLFEAEKEGASALLDSFNKLLSASQEAPSDSFDVFFEQIPPSKQPLLLVIEDAQLLGFDCLQELIAAYHRHGCSKKIHLCLVSDFSLSASLRRLEQDSFKHFIHTIEPGGLTEAETKTYVMRYAQGQKGASVLLAPERFKAFYAATQGQISAIHHQLSLLNDPQPKKHRSRHVWKALPSVVLSVVVLVGILLNVKPGAFLSAPPESLASETHQDVFVSYVAPWYVGVQVQAVQPPPLQKYVESSIQKAPQMEEMVALVDKVVVIPTFDTPHTQPKAPAQTHVMLSSKPGYTIQLLAAKNRRDLHEFMKKYHVARESVQIRQVWKQRERWYVLTMGGYPLLTQAQLAAQRLPKSLKQVGPWIRSDADLQDVG